MTDKDKSNSGKPSDGNPDDGKLSDGNPEGGKPADGNRVHANPDGASHAKPGRLRRFYLKFRKPIIVIRNVCFVAVIFALLVSFPMVRAISYPLFGQGAYVEIQDYCPVYTTEEIPAFRVQASGFNSYELQIYPFDYAIDSIGLNKFDQRMTAGDMGGWATIVANLKAEKAVAKKSGTLTARDATSAMDVIKLASPLPPGDYAGFFSCVTAFSPKKETKVVRFTVTNLGAIIKHDDEKLVVATLDLRTRKPWTKANVALFNPDSPAETIKPLASIATDARGIATLAKPESLSEDQWHRVKFDITDGRHAAYLCPQTGNTHGASGVDCFSDFSNNYFQRWATFMTTDRPIYRLGQPVAFKGTVRLLKPHGYVNAGPGTQMSLIVYDPLGTPMKEMTLRTDAFGTFESRLPAETLTKTGQYRIEIQDPDGRGNHSFPFQIEQYRKPEYKVEVIPEKPHYTRGDKVRFKVQANYYFGAPLKDAKIKYHIGSFADFDTKRSLTAQTTSNFFSGWESDQRFHPYTNSAYFDHEGTAITDASGQAFVELDTKPLKIEAKDPWSYNYLDEVLNVSVEVTDVSRKALTAEGAVPISHGDFAVFVESTNSAVQAGEDIVLNVKAIDYNKKPAAGRKVSLSLSRWKAEDWMNARYKIVKIDSASTVTDDKGQATLTFKTSKDLNSDVYYVTAEALDDKQREVGDVTSIWLFGEKNDYFFRNREEQEQLTVQLDKDVYLPGDRVRAVIKAPVAEGETARLLVGVEGSRLHDYRTIEMKGPTALVEFPVNSNYIPNAYVTASLVNMRHTPRFAQALLKVSPENHFVNLSISPDKPRYHPGDTARYTIKATAKNGSPVANLQLSAAVVDEGIFAVWETLKREQYIYDYEARDIQHAIFKMIENHVQTRFTFTEQYVASLPDRPVFDGLGLMILAGPLTWLMPNTYFGSAGVMCCKEADDLSALPPPSAMPGPALVGAPVDPRYGQSNEAGEAAGGAARTGGGQSQRPPVPRVRSNFLDAAAWYPSLVTDAAGTATFSLKLPDDLTTWRATVNGITSGIDVGSQTNSVMSTQDFIARLALPRFYTEGDETVVSGVVHNSSDKDQTVNLSVALTPNIKLLESGSATVVVPRDGVKRQSFKIKVLSPGEAKVTLKAIGSTMADAEERKLPVRAFGYRVFFAKNGILKNPNDVKEFPVVLPPDAKLATGNFELAASSSSIGPVLGNFEKLIDYPYGCTEQTLSRLIPSVIAKRLSTNLGVTIGPEMNKKFGAVYNIAMPKLQEYQHDDGGWGWWKDDSSSPYLTAHVLEGLYLLKQAGFKVDEGSTERGLQFLSSQVKVLSANPWAREESVDHAKSIYVLSLYGKQIDTLTKTWQLANLQKMAPESLAYLAMAFKNADETDMANKFYNRLKELRNDSLEYSNWDHTRELIAKLDKRLEWSYTYRFTGVETTALALRATVAMEPKNEELIEKITRWLILERDENGWDNTKCTATVFLALLEKELAQNPDRQTNYKASVEVLGKTFKEWVSQKTFERGEQLVSVPLSPPPGSIKLKKNGPGWLYYNTLLAYDRPVNIDDQVVLQSIPADLKLTRQMFRLMPIKPGEKIDPNLDTRNDPKLEAANISKEKVVIYRLEPLGDSLIKAGDLIMMKLTVDCPFNVPYAMVEAYLPSGGELVANPPQMAPDKNAERDLPDNWNWWTHQDTLDDRVTFFATRMPSGKSEFRAFIRMEMPGTFNLPPASMEAMYTNKIHGRSAAHRVQVVE